MTPLQIGSLAGALVAAAAWCASRSVRRAPRSLHVARRALYGDSRHSLADTTLGQWVEHRMGEQLATIGMGAADVITRAATFAGIAGFAVLAAAAALMAYGVIAVSALWLAAALAAAAAAALLSVHDHSSKVERRRRTLRLASNEFVQLIAVGLSTDQSVEEAVRFALTVGRGDAVDALRSELSTAPQRGVAIWEAIDEVGRRWGIRELGELAGSIERQALQGVSIGETVAALATAMRAKTLDQLERDADAANANLAGPTIGFVVTTIVFLAYPLTQRIGEAFGG